MGEISGCTGGSASRVEPAHLGRFPWPPQISVAILFLSRDGTYDIWDLDLEEGPAAVLSAVASNLRSGEINRLDGKIDWKICEMLFSATHLAPEL